MTGQGPCLDRLTEDRFGLTWSEYGANIETATGEVCVRSTSKAVIQQEHDAPTHTNPRSQGQMTYVSHQPQTKETKAMSNPNTGRQWAVMVMDAQLIGQLGNVRATTAFHPDGVSYRGVAHYGSMTASVCSHAHRTEIAARNCAAKTARSLSGISR